MLLNFLVKLLKLEKFFKFVEFFYRNIRSNSRNVIVRSNRSALPGEICLFYKIYKFSKVEQKVEKAERL